MRMRLKKLSPEEAVGWIKGAHSGVRKIQIQGHMVSTKEIAAMAGCALLTMFVRLKKLSARGGYPAWTKRSGCAGSRKKVSCEDANVMAWSEERRRAQSERVRRMHADPTFKAANAERFRRVAADPAVRGVSVKPIGSARGWSGLRWAYLFCKSDIARMVGCKIATMHARLKKFPPEEAIWMGPIDRRRRRKAA